MFTCDNNLQPSPIATSGPIKQNGPISTSAPRRAPSVTLAVGSILATASIVHDHGTDIGFGCEFATDLCFAVEPPHALLLRLFRHVIFHDISRNDGPAEFRLINGKEQNRFRRLRKSAR